jgi:glycosyltransferase involved in cell wall biosynthesis
MSRKILLIALGCYPSNVAGAHRPAKIAKFLPEFGWDPLILCAEWKRDNDPARFDPGLALENDACRTIRVPYPAPAGGRAGRAFRRFLTTVFPYTTPRSAVRSFMREASRIVESERVDAIWSTYRPGLTHLVAGLVSRRAGIPWVADFRDIPDQVHDTPRVRRTVRTEVAICSGASVITATSPASAARLAERHRAPVELVMNGFDPDDYDPAARPTGEVFDITYYGTLYEYFDPRPLFRALDLLHARGEIDLGRVAVEFYGPPRKQIEALARGFECARVVRARPRLPYREMLRRQQESVVLLAVKSRDAGTAIPLKILEYLGARRPVLCVPGDGGDVDAVLADTGAGRSAADPEEIASVVHEWYGLWSSSGTLPCESVPARLERYGRREQTRVLAQVLDGIRDANAATPVRASGVSARHLERVPTRAEESVTS